MTYPHKHIATCTLGALVLAACNDSPTEPENTAAPASRAESPIAEVAAMASNTWTRKADMPGGARIDVTTAAVPNAAGQSILYVMGGRTLGGGSLSRVQAYNVSSNSWTYRKQMPSPLYSTNGAGVIGGKIYVSGGRQQVDNKDSRPYLYVYDPSTNMWARKHDMPWYSAEGITAVIDNKLYVLTCNMQEFCTYEDRLAVYRYDPMTDQWTTVATSPFVSARPEGAAIERKFYFVSDRGDHFSDLSTQLTEYDPATNSWRTRAQPRKARFGGAAVAQGAQLYLIGGFEKQTDGVFRQVRIVRVFKPASNFWMMRAPLPEMRSSVTANRVTLSGGARIEVVGGPTPGSNLQYMP